MPKSKFAHFTLIDRKRLTDLLDKDLSFRKIALIIGCSTSSITNEVKSKRIFKDYSGGIGLRHCNSTRLTKAPYVCNGCNNLGHCKKSKYLYDSNIAHEKYLNTLKSSRRGCRASKQGLDYLNDKLVPLIKDNHQTIDHILLSNDLGVSRSTLYRYIDAGLLEIKNIDLKRRVKYTTNRKKKASTRVRISKKNRKYLDFLAYISANPKAKVVELDTVIGKRDEEVCILTMLLRKSNFMIGFLLESKTANEVVKVFNYIEKTLGKATFMTIFNVVLTDNGVEFDYVDELEANDRDIKRCHVFYCDPRCSNQKGKLEKNHEYIRYYLPKGTSFKGLKQEDITLMFSHINSVKRKELNNKSPFELLSSYELKAMKKLGYKMIAPQAVILAAKLIHR